jgi:acyl-CoA oxidase
VRLADNGHKTGLLGVDNGRMWFDGARAASALGRPELTAGGRAGVRVPREALLNRYADVDEHGVYRSPITDKVRRFAAMIGAHPLAPCPCDPVAV